MVLTIDSKQASYTIKYEIKPFYETSILANIAKKLKEYVKSIFTVTDFPNGVYVIGNC